MAKFVNGKALLILGVLLIVAYGAYNFLFPEKSMDNLTREERLAVKKNIVVLGVDERASEGDVGRSDTLFVVMFDPASKNVSLLSIPRDTRVNIPGYGWDKINHAYAFGGHKLTQQTVEELLGIRIDNYAMVDFKGFKGLVDAIGGIDINVEKDMYYYDEWDGFEINLHKGLQHLDGETAIQYVRYRDEEGDIGRIKRQQHFIMAVYNKITSAEMLLRVPGLAQQLTSMVKTDMPLSDMMDIGRALHSMMQNGGLVASTVPGTPRYIDDISYWLPDITDLRAQMVKMQGADMSEGYKRAAEIMEAKYNRAVEQAEEREADKAKETAEEKEADQDKAEEAEDETADDADKDVKDAAKAKDKKDKKAAADEKSSAKAKKDNGKKQERAAEGMIVRLVNCSGSDSAAEAAAAKLRGAGFTVISGGSGEVIASTTVISTTNNGAVVNKLSNIPFKHKMRIARDGAADCDGVVMLGKDFK